MSQAQLQIVSRCLGIFNCSKVTLCMKADWPDKTVSGLPFLIGTVVAQGTTKLPATVNGCYQPVVSSGVCPPCGNVYPVVPAIPQYTLDACTYVVNIELDDQVFDNPDTDNPWMPTANDVCEIIPFWCLPAALVTAFQGTFGIQVDATLKRDGNIIGINDLVYPDAGHKKLVGIDVAGNAVRVPEVFASATISSSSTSLAAINGSVVQVVDYDVIADDDFLMLTAGAAWHATIPFTGRYRVTAQIRYGNSTWKHHGGSDYAAVDINVKVNNTTTTPIGVVYASGFDDSSPIQQAPLVHGSRIFKFTKGDIVQIVSQHTDAVSQHAIINDASSFVNIEKIN